MNQAINEKQLRIWPKHDVNMLEIQHWFIFCGLNQILFRALPRRESLGIVPIYEHELCTSAVHLPDPTVGNPRHIDR